MTNNRWLPKEAPLPHFYLHFRQGETIIDDDEGLDAPDLATAQDEALKVMREIVAESVFAAHDVPDSIVITDADGKEITSITAASVLPPRLGR
jgi:hypothetical protein